MKNRTKAGEAEKVQVPQKVAVAGQFLKYLWQRFIADDCRQSAAALTYMSLFAVVPIMTLMYSMFSLVPAFQGLGDQVQALIFDNFVPQSGAEVQHYLTEFSAQARKLSALGAAILLLTSYLMLSNIERTFNNIWATAGGRKGLSSFLLYWGILSLGPLLLGVGLMMRTYLVSFQLIVDEADSLGLIAWVFEYLPLLLTWVAFTLLFLAVPNCKVTLRYAVIGGFVTTVCFELAKVLFGALVTNSNYASVYGAFAIVPIFLIWIYFMWIIVLGGAELVRTMETFKGTWRGYDYPDMIAMLVVFWECWQRQQRGQTIADKDMLAAGLEQQHWREIRDMLLARRVLVATNAGRYVLTRDPARLRLIDLMAMKGLDAFELPGRKASERLSRYPWYQNTSALMANANQILAQNFSLTLAELYSAESAQSEESETVSTQDDEQ